MTENVLKLSRVVSLYCFQSVFELNYREQMGRCCECKRLDLNLMITICFQVFKYFSIITLCRAIVHTTIWVDYRSN